MRAAAWGFDVHRFIAERAIELLPPALRAFYDTNRRFVVEHTIDPDLWRLAGFEEERPHHFLNLDAFGKYPFKDLPRDHDEAVKRFGAEMFQRHGLLPWRTAEMHARLRRAFEEQRRTRRSVDQIHFFSAVVAHYVADAHVPFHAVLNHDGQLTGQQGIHARFETDLFTRFRQQLRITPAAPKAIGEVAPFIFDTLVESFGQAEPVLKADRDARAASGDYDTPYYRQFLVAVRPLLERRLATAITATASVWQSAWVAAGSPTISAGR